MALSEAVKSQVLREFKNEILQILADLKDGDYEVEGIDENILRTFGIAKYDDGSEELALYNQLLDEALLEIRSFIPKMLELTSENCQDIVALTKQRNPDLATCSVFDDDYRELAAIKGWIKSDEGRGISEDVVDDILRRGEADPVADEPSPEVDQDPDEEEDEATEESLEPPNLEDEEEAYPEVDPLVTMFEALDVADKQFFRSFVSWYKSMGPDHRRTYLEDLQSGEGTWLNIKENRLPLYDILVRYFDRHGLHG